MGDLPADATEKAIEREFNFYGVLKSVWVARNPSGKSCIPIYAYVSFIGINYTAR